MRLAVSNLALPADCGPARLAALAEAGVRGIEVAPTRLAPWTDLTEARLSAYRAELAAAGLTVSSLQAIFFAVEGVALLGEVAAFERMLAHVATLGRIAEALGTRIAVLGAPRQRARNGLPPEIAWSLGAERLSLLAETAHDHGLVIALEPVPAEYGGDFLPDWQGMLGMVTTVDHPALRAHLDTACVLLGGGAIQDAVRASAPVLAHFHIAEPKLAGFAAPVAGHAAAAAALAEAGYRGWAAIEMLEQSAEAVLEAVHFAAATYGVDDA